MTLVTLYYLWSLRLVNSKMENITVSLSKECEECVNLCKAQEKNAWGHSIPSMRVNFCYLLLASVRGKPFLKKKEQEKSHKAVSL